MLALVLSAPCLGLGLGLASSAMAQGSALDGARLVERQQQRVANDRMNMRFAWAILGLIAVAIPVVRKLMKKAAAESVQREAKYEARQDHRNREEEEEDDSATRACPSCSVVSDIDADFCKACATRLSPRGCDSCGSENDADARFCIQCAGSLS